jgi:signal transduction histidine kinase
MLAADFSAPRNARHVRPNGRVLESVSDPLPGGGFAISVSDVTALVTTEHALAERGRVLDTVLAASRSGMAVYDADQRLVLHNAAYTAILGLAPDALPPGFRFAELVGLLQARGEYANIEAEPYIAALLGADHKRPHARRRPRPNGQVLEIASDPLPDGGFVVTVSDVTALARAEEETRARAATLESVLASLPQGISLFGPDRRVRLVNPAYAAIMGDAAAQPGEAMAQLIERRRRAGEYGQGAAADAYAIEAGTDFQHAARRRRSRPDGTTIDVRTRPLPDGGHISVVTDVTLEVAAQAEAERRTRMLDLMMAHVNHGMVLFDADERVVLFNSQGEALAGIEPGWLRPGHTRQEIILHLRARGIYGRGPEADRMAQDFSSRDPHRVQHIQRTLPDGRVIELRSDPLPGGGCVVATWDVSWRRETEAQMRAAKEAAEAASRAKSSFLATISHELRTPLNAVIGFSEAIAHELERLAAGADSAQRIGEYAQAVNDGGRHLLGLINDILDVARIESGTVELAETEFDLAMLVGQCRRMIDVAARVAQVRLETHLPAALPRVRGDEPRLRQVLLNLLSNAVKFTPAGGVVRVGAELPTDQALLLTVQDTGIGIAPADIDRAFEPFTRLDTEMGRRSAGSGLGLFLSRALAEAHGGSLDLRSTPGQGTTAILRLPAARVLHSTPRMPISAP